MRKFASGFFLCIAAVAQEPLTIRVWNYSAVENEVIASAQQRVAHVLALTGVVIRWLECNPKQGRPAECAAVLTPVDVVLRIQTRGTLQGTFGSYVLGRAFSDSLADVYDAEIRTIGESQVIPLVDAYTIAITHEVGHLLLGPGAHSSGGLMRARWGGAELRAVSKGEFRLNPSQANLGYHAYYVSQQIIQRPKRRQDARSKVGSLCLRARHGCLTFPKLLRAMPYAA